MKTITVSTTTQKKPSVEVKYAVNDVHGITYFNEGEGNEDLHLFPEAVRLRVEVADMFPGTHQEWETHIHDCIVDQLKAHGLTYEGRYGTYLRV